jgi:hypothetical protein
MGSNGAGLLATRPVSFAVAYPQSIGGIDRPRVRKLALVLKRTEI